MTVMQRTPPDSVLIIDAWLEAGQAEAHAQACIVGVHEAVVVDAAVVAQPHRDAHLGLGLRDVLEDVDGFCKQNHESRVGVPRCLLT